MFEDMLNGQPPRIVQEPVTGRVVRSDASGVWVVPLGGDTRHPVGPCRGGWRRNDAGVLELVGVGVVVLIVWTQERPWVAGWDKGPTS